MRVIKILKFLLPLILLSTFFTNYAKSTDECFENTSRAIFKFNMALDDIILEPIAKGYNKLPEPIKVGTGKTLQNLFVFNIHKLIL